MRHRLWRDSAFVIHTRTQRRWPWVLGAITALVGLLAATQALDARSDPLVDREVQLVVGDHDPAVQEAIHMAFQLGRAKGHAEMIDSAHAAWESARIEAERCSAKGGAL